MDKNIAALMRQDTRTVQCVFSALPPDLAADADMVAAFASGHVASTPKAPDARAYTYVTDLPLEPGDIVVVEANASLKVVVVRTVDEDVKIEPNSDTAYKWVLAKVDLTGYAATAKRNAEIEQVVSEAYRHNLRRSFASQILAGIDDDNRARVAALIGGK
jgi:hypothetical protein